MINSTCWLYAGYTNKDDYGEMQLSLDGRWRKYRVHRLVYEALVGEIPKGLVLDHLCRIPRCINPDHLEPVTDRVNILRGIGLAAYYAKRTHCKNGHEYTNGSYFLYGKNARRCKQCMANYQRKYRASK